MCQISSLHSLNLHNVLCQMHFNEKKWARKKQKVAHKTCPLMFYQREESCPDCIGEALPTPPIIQGSRCLQTSLLNSWYRLSHFLLITLLQNKGYNFLYFTYKHLLFAWHLKPQTKMIQTDTVVTFLESTLSWRE